ncbi:MAG: MurR/RpiR family transcriptional regulator [Clostridia bacterium]|nr:MurR/RpiR family transcriptional regulator [Clostridia bacterium]
MNVLARIKQQYSAFSKSQRRIADYVLNHYAQAANMTASKLADTVSVSESTVVRFATGLGYLGYPEFIDALLEYSRSESSMLKRMESLSLALENQDVLTKVIHSDIDNLKTSLHKIDRKGFDGAVDALLQAKNIYIIGFRSSACLASFLSFYCNLLFSNVRLIQTNSVSEMFEQILRIEQGDVVFGISFPRYSRRTVKAMEFAKSRGATIIALTDSEKSPIAPFSDCLMTAKSEMVSCVDSLVAPFSVLNAFIVSLVLRKQNDVATAFEELENIWEEYDVYDKRELTDENPNHLSF